MKHVEQDGVGSAAVKVTDTSAPERRGILGLSAGRMMIIPAQADVTSNPL